MMEKRRLGKSDISITPLMLGGNVFGWTADEKTSFAIFDAFVEQGGDAIDTADAYQMWLNQPGVSETIIGRWFKQSGKRDKIVIATKVGLLPERLGIRADNIVAACDDSLRRLQTDVIDLYQLHRDYDDVPVEEFLNGLERVVKAGKVRVIGASGFGAPRLAAALRESASRHLPRFETLQPEYHLLNRALEKDVLPLCVRESVSVIPYYSLASGYLTGKYRTEADKQKSPRGARMDAYMNGNGPAVLAALDAVSARRNASLAQVALAWLLSKPAIAAPIASATSLAQLADIMGSVRLQLTPEDLAELDRASAPALDAKDVFG